MQYFGGKAKIAKVLAGFIASVQQAAGGLAYVEPFVGGANVVARLSGPREASDLHPGLIAMFQALQGGWVPPSVVTRELYDLAKTGLLLDPVTAFIGFACSFSGKYFGGFAQNDKGKAGDNFASQGRNSLLRKLDGLRDVAFTCADYRTLAPVGKVVYCDPPYRGRVGYSVGAFDTGEFWDVVRVWSRDNIVLVSEYEAPPDFVCVWSATTLTDMRTSEGREVRVEKLFALL